MTTNILLGYIQKLLTDIFSNLPFFFVWFLESCILKMSMLVSFDNQHTFKYKDKCLLLSDVRVVNLLSKILFGSFSFILEDIILMQ